MSAHITTSPPVVPTLADPCESDDETQKARSEERRASGRRARARDRLFDRAVAPQSVGGALAGIRNVENLLLFVDDDLRETTLALTRIEGFLLEALGVLEARTPQRRDVQALATDPGVLEQLDILTETLESLRRRLARLASVMK